MLIEAGRGRLVAGAGGVASATEVPGNDYTLGNLTVHLVSNPPRTLYRVLTSSICGSSSLKRSSAILAVACSWKIPTLR